MQEELLTGTQQAGRFSGSYKDHITHRLIKANAHKLLETQLVSHTRTRNEFCYWQDAG